MLHQLISAGKLNDVKAVVLGDFSDGDEHVDYAITNFAKEHSQVPMFKTEQIGHSKYNIPVVYAH